MADGSKDKRLREVRPEDPLKDYMTWEGSGHQGCTCDRGACITLKFSCGSPLQARANGRRRSHRAWLISGEGDVLQDPQSKQ